MANHIDKLGICEPTVSRPIGHVAERNGPTQTIQRRTLDYLAYLCLGLLCIETPSAQADTITVNFAGTVNEVNENPFGLGLTVGAGVTGTYQYESGAGSLIGPGTDSFGGNGFTFPTNMSLVVDGNTILIESSESSHVRVSNNVDFEGTPFDAFILTTDNLDGSDGTPQPLVINGSGGFEAEVESALADSTATAFSTDTVMPTSLNLSDFNFALQFQLTDTILSNEGPKTSFEFEFTSLSTSQAAVIPEPSTMLLLATGLVPLGSAFGRRKRQRHQPAQARTAA